jgi:hypothetical protein
MENRADPILLSPYGYPVTAWAWLGFDARSANLPARRETEVRNPRGSTRRNLCGRAGKSS